MKVVQKHSYKTSNLNKKKTLIIILSTNRLSSSMICRIVSWFRLLLAYKQEETKKAVVQTVHTFIHLNMIMFLEKLG